MAAWASTARTRTGARSWVPVTEKTAAYSAGTTGGFRSTVSTYSRPPEFSTSAWVARYASSELNTFSEKVGIRSTATRATTETTKTTSTRARRLVVGGDVVTAGSGNGAPVVADGADISRERTDPVGNSAAGPRPRRDRAGP